MVTKFDRIQIEAINNAQSAFISKNKDKANHRSMVVPEKETFKYVFENAKKGNEMAAVLLDEWQKTCEPKNNKEKQVIQLINTAVGRIFK